MTTPEELEAAVRQALSPGLLLVRRLGEGGMGSVFLAREPALKRLVAVKVLAPQLASDPNARARFEREAQAVAGLAHANVVAIHGVGELADGTPYFVMQHVAGRSMAARLEAEGPLDLDEARRIIGEVASALAAAHAKGIIHRDIKPANILYDEESGRVLVSDFGIAALLDRGPDEGSTKLTQTGMLIGTPQYMSPEQLLSEPVTELTDVYALGLLGYELVAGAGPFTATTPQELIAMHLRDVPPRLSAKRADLDPELEALITGCLNKDPAKRPTAADVARRLAPGAGIPLEWPPPGLDELRGALPRLSRRFWLGSLALVAAMLGFVAMGTQLSSAASSLGNITFSLLAVGGTIAIVRAVRGLLQDGRRAADALNLGYSWFTIAETAADHRGDTGALLAGAREYSTLDAATRGDLRRGRVASAILPCAGSVLPVPLIVVTAWLGAVGIAGAEAAPWIVLGPPLVALAAAAVIERREQRAVASARRALRQRRQRTSNLPRLIGPWYESYDAVTREQPLGRGRSGSRRLAWGLTLTWSALALAAVVALVPLWVVGALGPELMRSFDPSGTEEKYAIARITRDFAPAPDPSITPRQAGDAFWALQATAGPAPRIVFAVLPARRLPEFPKLAPNDPRFANRHPGWQGPALFVGVEGKWDFARLPRFSPAERAWLAELTNHPAWREFSAVARARSADLLGAHYVLPFPDAATWSALPIPQFAGTKAVAYANGARAAYYMSEGRHADAERVLRETVGFGFQMTGSGSSLIEELIGVVIVGIGRGQLIEYYTMTGRPEAALLRARRDSVLALHDRGALVPRSVPRTYAEIRQAMTAKVFDTTLARGERFEMLAMLGLAPCTNVRELVFGPARGLDTTFARARRELARFAADTALIDLMLRASVGGSRSAQQTDWYRRAIVGAARLAGRMLHNRRFGGCAELLATVNAY